MLAFDPATSCCRRTLGLVAAGVFVAWVEPRADAFVRRRDCAED